MRHHSKLQSRAGAWLCYIGVILISVLLDAAVAQSPFAHGNDVSFSISTQQKRYEIGEQITVSYKIKNVGNGPLFVPRAQWDTACSEPPHLWALLESSSGQHFEPGFIGRGLGAKECNRLGVSEWLKQDAVLLKPQQSVSGTFTFQFPRGRFVQELKPGIYRLEALLYGWNAPFTESQRRELDTIPGCLLVGEANATTQIELTARRH
jgi:hypothetical protein